MNNFGPRILTTFAIMLGCSVGVPISALTIMDIAVRHGLLMPATIFCFVAASCMCGVVLWKESNKPSVNSHKDFAGLATACAAYSLMAPLVFQA